MENENKHINKLKGGEKTTHKELINHVEYLTEQLDRTISYKEHIVKNMDDMKEYMDYLAEHLEKYVTYNVYLSSHLRMNDIIPYTMGEFTLFSDNEKCRIEKDFERKIKIKKIIERDDESEEGKGNN